MKSWLIVTLAAPLASFGEEAGNAQRGTANAPTRSALLGLAGAALGTKRDDDVGNKHLSDSFSTATRTLQAGSLMEDFHTFQSVPQSKGWFSTRAHALRAGEAVTSITRRQYRSDGLWQAAFGAKPDAHYRLEALMAAFMAPVFVLYLGRKSCPLSHPLVPRLIEAGDLAQAFREHGTQSGLKQTKPSVIASDNRDDLPQSNNPVLKRRRMDQPENRDKWHFSPRDEWSVVTHAEGEISP